MKRHRFPPKICIIIFFLSFLFAFVDFFGSVTCYRVLSLDGFGVGNNGLMYVGSSNNIDVVDGSNVIKTKRVYNYTQDGYYLQVEGDKVIIYTNSCIYVLDENLNYISEYEKEKGEELYKLRAKKYNPIIAPDGSEYMYHDGLGGYYITRSDGNDEIVVYHMSLFSYIMRTLMFIIIPLFVLNIIFMLFIWNPSGRE